LIQSLREWQEAQAIAWRHQSYSYRWLCNEIDRWRQLFPQQGVTPGRVVALHGSYSPQVCALLLALMENRNIIVPLTSAPEAHTQHCLKIAQAEVVFRFDEDEVWKTDRTGVGVSHPLLKQLQESGAPGLVLFSSGSTGEPKAALHNLDSLLEKFKTRRHRLRTLAFLLLDHIGGINTLFYTLFNGGTVVSMEDRSPQSVCQAIEQYRVEMLPTSPTFLSLLLISEEHRNFDLSSLRWITYGTEPMSATTLERLNSIFPNVRFQQTYGLSELGILRSKSKDSSSLWVKVGGEGYETKVVDNVLWIRTRYSMLGYLNAPSPFDEEGWFNTQDVVEVEGEYLRILGRETDIINVGGEKVYPAQVEGVLLGMNHVRDVTVRGQKNPILGQVVVAQFHLSKPESLDSLKRRVREYCKDKLPRYQIPARIEISDQLQSGQRFKKNRNPLVGVAGQEMEVQA